MSKKLSIVWNYLAHYKYLIVILTGFLMVGVLDDNSVRQHIKYQMEIAALRAEVKKYRDRYESDLNLLRQLRQSNAAYAKIARQRYFMKKDNEDIFVLSTDIPADQEGEGFDDSETTTSTTTTSKDNETIE